MPEYVITTSPSHRSHTSHHTRSRSGSHSGRSQPIVYSSSGHSTGSRRYTTSRDHVHRDGRPRRASSSSGHGSHHYYPSSSGRHHSGSHGAPVYYTQSTGTHRRSYSVPRNTAQVIDSRRYSTTSSGRRPSVSYVADSGRHHHPSDNNQHHVSHKSTQHKRRHSDSFGDRVRRFFGLNPSHHNRSSSKAIQYQDSRTGQPCDARGRPIYRV